MADFNKAFENTMQHEDSTHVGKVTVDAGGRTRFGIAAKFHPDLAEEFFTRSAEEALEDAEQIEQRDYWDRMRLSEVENQNVANKLFDMEVNMGVHQASIYAQRVTNFLLECQGGGDVRVAEDGMIGDKTLEQINMIDPVYMLQYLREFSAAHYRHIVAVNPAQAVNLEGWLRRAAA